MFGVLRRERVRGCVKRTENYGQAMLCQILIRSIALMLSAKDRRARGPGLMATMNSDTCSYSIASVTDWPSVE